MGKTKILFKVLMESMTRLVITWGYVVKHGFAHWKLLSSVMIGVLLASTIMAGTVLYFDSLKQLALKHTLSGVSSSDLNILIETKIAPTTADVHAEVAGMVEDEINSRVNWILRSVLRGGRTPTFYLTSSGNEHNAGQDNARTYFTFLPELNKHVTILSGGGYPSPNALRSSAGVPQLEVLIPEDSAIHLDLEVGDNLSAVPVWGGDVPFVSVVVSGLFRKNKPLDNEFWDFEERSLRSVSGSDFRSLPLFVPRESFMNIVGASLPKMESTYAWFLKVDVGQIDTWNSSMILSDMYVMNQALAGKLSNYSQISELDNALRQYDKRIFFSRVSMFVVLILIVIVVLYYITTLSSLVIESRRAEISLLRSRGSDKTQTLTAFAVEGATIALIAVIGAPVLAAMSIGGLGFTAPFSGLTGGTSLSVNVTRTAYILSAVGGILSFVAIMIPAFQASKVQISEQRRRVARPSTLHVLQRYYIDIFLLVLSILLFVQLTEKGSMLATNKLGQVTTDHVLLALPGFVLLASAMVLLRFFPLIMKLASKLLSRNLPVGPVLGLWQMARSPTHYARLSLLLILTSGLGIFASSFGTTIQRSFEERILYSTGSDINVFNVRSANSGIDNQGKLSGTRDRDGDSELAVVSIYGDVSGVKAISPVLRGVGLDLTKTSGGAFDIIAIDGDTFGDIAWFRHDFSEKPIKDLFDLLDAEHIPRGLDLPENASTIALRIKSDKLHPSVSLALRLRNSDGVYSNYIIGQMDSTGWRVFHGSLSQPGNESFFSKVPLTLVSIQLAETSLDRRLLAGSLFLDEVSVTTESGKKIVVENFDDASSWAAMRNTPDSVYDQVSASRDLFDVDSGTMLFYWGVGGPIEPRGIFYGESKMALPVLASHSFAKSANHDVGDEFDVRVGYSRMKVKLVGIFEMFPTMVNLDKNLLVADITAISRYANLPATERDVFEVDLMISTDTIGIERRNLLDNLSQVNGYTSTAVSDRSERLAKFMVDPLVEAGWNAILGIAFLAVLTLSCVAFIVHAYISFQNREFHLALLRAVGLSVNQLISMVWLEQMSVVALGLALGAWMGGRLGATIMPFLAHDNSGSPVVPPFEISVSWGSLILSYFAMVVVFAVITLVIVWLVRRMSIHRVLRLGDSK